MPNAAERGVPSGKRSAELADGATATRDSRRGEDGLDCRTLLGIPGESSRSRVSGWERRAPRACKETSVFVRERTECRRESSQWKRCRRLSAGTLLLGVRVGRWMGVDEGCSNGNEGV